VSDRPEERGAHAPGGVPEARRALVAWVDEAGDAGRVFLQARLLATGGGRYEVRHRRDVHRSLESLEWVSGDPFLARDIAQTTNAGEHRPLKTSPNLKQGWALVGLDGAGLWTALEYLYPAAAVHWHAGRAGSLRVTHWRETAARQSGIYSAVRLLGDDAVRDAVRACCADAVCLRRVAWRIDAETPLALAGEGPVEGDAPVPCPEACSMFVSFARQVLKLERAPRREVPGLARLGADELAQVRAVVAAAASGTAGSAREGEFENPNNLRRIRYLAARLADANAGEREEADGLPCEGCPRRIPCAGCPLAEPAAA
jgi:hypothetical protein